MTRDHPSAIAYIKPELPNSRLAVRKVPSPVNGMASALKTLLRLVPPRSAPA